MKRISIFLATAAIAALATLSCNKNELNVPETSGPRTRISIGAKPEVAEEATRTYIEEDATTPGTYHSKWSNSGEELGVIFGEITDKSKSIKLTAEETTENDPIFTGNATLDNGTYNMFLFYPASAFEKCYSAGTVGLNLKAVQHPVLGTFDPSCDIMGWSTDNAVVENSSFTLEGITLARPMAILRINLNAPTGGGKALEEGIGSVTGFKMEVAPGETSSEKVTLTGRAALVPDTGEINNWNVENNYVEASIDAAEMITIGESEGFQSVYLIVNPATIPSGREITFSVETEKYSGVNKIVRTVTAPADMAFEAGKVNTINLTLRDKDFPAEVIDEDYNGDWLITGVKNDVTYAALAYGSGNNLKATAALTFSADGSTISSDTDLSDCIMTFTKVTEGDYTGMYTIQDANGKYLYAAASGSNYLKAKDEPDVNAYWTVTMEGEEYSIIASKSSNRNVMRFNPNGNNDPLVSCYGSASQSPVKLYPASMISGLTTDPLITFEGEESGRVEKTVPASTTTVEFPYTKNKYVTELPTLTKVGGLALFDGEPVVSDDKVTINIIPNTDETDKRIIVRMTGQGLPEGGVGLTIVQQAYEPAAVLTIKSLNDQVRTDNVISSASAKEYSGNIQDVVITGVKGDYTFAEDATGGILIYKVSGLQAGKTYSGETTIKAFMYNKMPEATSFPTTGLTVGTASIIPSTTYTSIADLTDVWDAKMSMRSVLQNVTVKTAFSNYNATVEDAAGNTLTVRDYAKQNLSLNIGDQVTITGYPAQYNTTKQFAVLDATDITVSSNPGSPSLSVSPNELSWATNEYGQSSAKEVTVTLNAEVDEDNYTISGSDDNWVVTPYGGNGGTISVYPKTANTGSSARTFSFDVVHADDNTVKQTVTCTQAANAVTISTILADATVTSSNTVNYEVDGVTVMAAQGGKNYVIGDATGVMLMYVNKTLTVGKQYKVSGGVKLYNGVHEFTGTLNITESTGTAPAAGTPETMTVSSLTAYAAAPVTKYAVVTATAQSSGYLCSDGTNTINVYDGTGTWSQFYGKQVKITGYLIGFYNGNINMIATAIEDNTDPNAPSISADVNSLIWAANEYGASAAKSITVTLNASASATDYSYTATSGSAGDWNISKDGFVITVSPKAANTSTTADKVLTLKIAHSSDATVYKEVTLTQSKVSSGGTPNPETIVFANWSPALENGVQYSSPFNGGNFTITFAGGGNDGKYYTSGSGIRTYGGGTITVASSYTISKIEFTWDGSYSPTSDVASPSGYSTSTKAWTGSAKSVVLTRPSGSGHWRLQSVKVTYE